MATPSTDELLALARGLPVRERARLVRDLIDSLDEERADEDAEQAWAVEISRRAREVLAGKAVVLETGEVFERVRDELDPSRRETAQTTPGVRGRPPGGRKAVRGRGSRTR
jgi:putative addiction module component (TIGR02574 family)